MKRYFFCLMLGSAVFALKPLQAMENDQFLLEVPEEFPGHLSRPIRGIVTIPDHFDQAHYQQNKSRAESVCAFQSMLAGIMSFDYGRSMVKASLQDQNDQAVYFKFCFPGYDIMKVYERVYYTKQMETYQSNLSTLQTELKNASGDKEEIQLIMEDINHYEKCLQTLPLLWEKIINSPQTVVKVPKQFVTRDEKSFPQNNPEWLNLLQQANKLISNDMLLTGVVFLGEPENVPAKAKIKKSDAFYYAGSFFYRYGKGLKLDDNLPEYLNFIYKTPDVSWKNLLFSPFLDIPLKEFRYYPDKEKGIDLETTVDLEATDQDDKKIYNPITYKTITEFAHQHRLSKDLLMANNVVQISSEGHAVVLIFGHGKVMYYDNVFYDHPSQISVYGKTGPIYEEAKHFEGLPLESMGEEEFFTRFFKEINHRRDQVSEVRGKKAFYELNEYGKRHKETLMFFERSLVDH